MIPTIHKKRLAGGRKMPFQSRNRETYDSNEIDVISHPNQFHVSIS